MCVCVCAWYDISQIGSLYAVPLCEWLSKQRPLRALKGESRNRGEGFMDSTQCICFDLTAWQEALLLQRRPAEVQLQGHKGDTNVHSRGSSCSAGELLSEDWSHFTCSHFTEVHTRSIQKHRDATALRCSCVKVTITWMQIKSVPQ